MAVRVEVVTRNMRNGEVESVKYIDHDNSSDRKWLGTHCFWAMRNGRSVRTTPHNEFRHNENITESN